MAIGSILGLIYNVTMGVKLDWETEYNKEKDAYSIHLSLYFVRPNTETEDLTIKGTFRISVGTNASSWLISETIPNNGEWENVHSSYMQLTGKGISVNCSGSFDVLLQNGEWEKDKLKVTLNGNVKFDTLDDQAKFVSVAFKNAGYLTTGYLTDDIEITYKTEGDTYDSVECMVEGISWYFRLGKTYYTERKKTIQHIPIDKLQQIYQKIPNDGEIRIQFKLCSYTDDQYTEKAPGSVEWNYRYYSLKVPTDEMTMPTGELKCEPVSTLEGDLAKLYWPTRSKIKAEILNDAGKYGATIVSKKIQIIAQEGDSPLTSGIIAGTNPITVRGTITDTRGISRTLEQVITPVAYGTPQIKPYGDNAAIVVARCDKDGNLTDEGTQFKIAAKREFTKINYEGKQITFCSLSYRVKKIGGAFNDEWITILEDKAQSDEQDIVIGSDGDYEIEQAYVVQLKAEDSIGNSIVLTFNLPSDKVYMHRSGRRNSIAFGGYVSHDNSFEVYQEATLHGGLVLKSESGDNYYRITVSDGGTLTVTPLNAAQTFLLKRGNK